LTLSLWGGFYNREIKQFMLRHGFQFVESGILAAKTQLQMVPEILEVLPIFLYPPDKRPHPSG